MTVAPKYVLALEEARRASAAQDANFSGLRSQAGFVVTTAGLAATFLGGVRSHGHLSAAIVVAVVAFGLLVLLAGWILLPTRLFTTQNARVILSWTDEHDADENDQRRKLVEELADQYKVNATRIFRRQIAYTAAMLFLVVELAAFVTDMWRG